MQDTYVCTYIHNIVFVVLFHIFFFNEFEGFFIFIRMLKIFFFFQFVKYVICIVDILLGSLRHAVLWTLISVRRAPPGMKWGLHGVYFSSIVSGEATEG